MQPDERESEQVNDNAFAKTMREAIPMVSRDSIIADIIDAIDTQFVGVDEDIKSYFKSIYIRQVDVYIEAYKHMSHAEFVDKVALHLTKIKDKTVPSFN